MNGPDEPVEGDGRDLMGRLKRTAHVITPIVCVIGAFLMTYFGLFMVKGVEINTEEFDEALRSNEPFVVHGKLDHERKVTDAAGDEVYSYSIVSDGRSSGWPVVVSSDRDLGDNRDDVYIRVVQGYSGYPAIPEMIYLNAESGAVHPIFFWIGLGLVVIGFVGLVKTKRSTERQASDSASS